jgi:hypothetical protein
MHPTQISFKSGYTLFICNRRQARKILLEAKANSSHILGGNISYFKAAGTSDASYEMEEVAIAEH